MVSLTAPLNDNELKEIVNIYLNELINKFAKVNPSLAEDIKENKEGLSNLMVNTLKINGPKMTRGNMKDKEFVEHLNVALTTALHCKFEIDSDKELQKQLKLICGDKNIPELLKKLKKLDPNELEDALKNEFTPEQLKQMQELILKKTALLLKNDSNKLLDKAMKPTPGKQETPADKQAKQADPYANLLGIITSSITGGIPIVVQCYLGNGLGIRDFDPNDGMAHINDINKVNTLFGDSFGIEEETRKNFVKLSGNQKEINEAVFEGGNAFLSRPTNVP